MTTWKSTEADKKQLKEFYLPATPRGRLLALEALGGDKPTKRDAK
jgi:hypothetical protein